MQPAKPETRRPARTKAVAWLAGAACADPPAPRARRLSSATAATATSPRKPARRRPRNASPVSLATVYNTLRAFCQAGLLHEVTVDGTRSYFDTASTTIPTTMGGGRRLTDAPNEAIRLAARRSSPAGAELDRVDVVIRLRRRADRRRRQLPPRRRPDGRAQEADRAPGAAPNPLFPLSGSVSLPGGSRGAGEGPPRGRPRAARRAERTGTGRRPRDPEPAHAGDRRSKRRLRPPASRCRRSDRAPRR